MPTGSQPAWKTCAGQDCNNANRTEETTRVTIFISDLKLKIRISIIKNALIFFCLIYAVWLWAHKHHDSSFLKHRYCISQKNWFAPIHTSLFLSEFQIVRDPTRTKWTIWMLVEEMPKNAYISRCVTWRSWIISSRNAQRLFLDDIHDLRLRANVGHDWIYYGAK